MAVTRTAEQTPHPTRTIHVAAISRSTPLFSFGLVVRALSLPTLFVLMAGVATSPCSPPRLGRCSA